MVESGAYSFAPEVIITNKFTLDTYLYMEQDSKVIRNDVANQSFFTVEAGYPYKGLAPLTHSPALVFSGTFSPSNIGYQHIVQYAMDQAADTDVSAGAASLQAIQASVQKNEADIKTL